MKKLNLWSLLFPLLILLQLISCSKKEPQSGSADLIPQEEIHISDAWARPGSVDGNSAVYFLISNGYTEPDTIASVKSEIAEISEVHETYERGEGMMGMRYIEELALPPQSTVRFRPGSFHIMLMQLKETISEGDTVKVTINLKNHGSVDLKAPVQMK
jgi:periplasmic copper chaperone A